MQPGRDLRRIQIIPDIILPSQVDGIRQDSGERRLRRAILQDAVNCLRGLRSCRGPYGNRSESWVKARLMAEAEAWFRSDETDYPFSFVNVCTALGLEVGWLRKRLLSGPVVEFAEPRTKRSPQ